MAEDIQELEVKTKPPGTRTTERPSGLKVGLAITAMTLNPLLGLGAGIAQRFKNKSFFQKEAAQNIANQGIRGQIKATLDREKAVADPAELRALQYAEGRVADAYAMIGAGNDDGYAILEHAQSIIESIHSKDMDDLKQEAKANNDMQRELVSNAAKGLRQEVQDTFGAVNGINRNVQQVLDLVAQKDFDPNNPLNKAHLAELISVGGIMFKDTPDLAEGLAQGIGAINGVAGGIAGGLATMLKSESFKVTPEMYNRIALNMQKYAKLYGEQKLEQVGSQTKNLDALARKNKMLADDFSLGDYVTGGEKELRMTDNPIFTGGYQSKTEPTRVAPTSNLGTGRFPGTGRGGSGPKPTRPTN